MSINWKKRTRRKLERQELQIQTTAATIGEIDRPAVPDTESKKEIVTVFIGDKEHAPTGAFVATSIGVEEHVDYDEVTPEGKLTPEEFFPTGKHTTVKVLLESLLSPPQLGDEVRFAGTAKALEALAERGLSRGVVKELSSNYISIVPCHNLTIIMLPVEYATSRTTRFSPSTFSEVKEVLKHASFGTMPAGIFEHTSVTAEELRGLGDWIPKYLKAKDL